MYSLPAVFNEIWLNAWRSEEPTGQLFRGVQEEDSETGKWQKREYISENESFGSKKSYFLGSSRSNLLWVYIEFNGSRMEICNELLRRFSAYTPDYRCTRMFSLHAKLFLMRGSSFAKGRESYCLISFLSYMHTEWASARVTISLYTFGDSAFANSSHDLVNFDADTPVILV